MHIFSRQPGGTAKSVKAVQPEGAGHRHRSSTAAERARRFSRVPADDAKITFENMLHSVRSLPARSVDKESVARMIGGIYSWLSADKNGQIELPVPAGSNEERRMWPHGATVDSRRKLSIGNDDKQTTHLSDLDEEVGSVVASSVVSSTPGEDRRQLKKGRVMSPADAAAVESNSHSTTREQLLGGAHVQRAHSRPPPRQLPNRPAGRFSLLPEMTHAPPVRVAESPEPSAAKRAPSGGGVKSVRVGTVGRAVPIQGDENRVVFADDSSEDD